MEFLENHVTAGAHQTECEEYSIICMLTKFNSNGEVVWSTFFRGVGASTSQIAVDGDNNIYLVGLTWGSTGIATEGAFQESLSTNEMVKIIPTVLSLNLIVMENSNGELIILQIFTPFLPMMRVMCT